MLDLSGAQSLRPAEDACRPAALERLSLWNCAALDDSAASVLAAAAEALANLDLSYTAAGDGTLKAWPRSRSLKYLYLTDTKVTPAAVEAFRQAETRPLRFLGVRRPEPSRQPPPSRQPEARQ